MKIVFFGDSITDMRRERTDIYSVFGYGSGYPFFVAGDLLKEDPTAYEFVNQGISGNRIVDLYAREKIDLINYAPDVVSILIGVNDVWHEIFWKNGVELDRFETVYQMLINDIKKALPNAKFIIMEPFVLKGTATEEHYEEFCEVKKYAKVVEKLAKNNGCTFVPLQAKFDEMSEKFGVEKYLYDGVHPAVSGARLIADEWIKAFNKEIK